MYNNIEYLIIKLWIHEHDQMSWNLLYIISKSFRIDSMSQYVKLEGQVIKDTDWTRVLVKHSLTNNKNISTFPERPCMKPLRYQKESMAQLI